MDNTIVGFGSIINGDGDLVLHNDAHGIIDANAADQTLTLNTGSNVITNTGLLEATDHGDLVIQSDVNNVSGTIEASSGGVVDVQGNISGGQAIIVDGTLEYDGQSDVATSFTAGFRGALVLGAGASFTGTVSGFAAGDAIDLGNVAFASGEYAVWTQVATGSDAAGTLQIYNSDRVLEATLNLAGTYTQSEFALAADGTAVNGTSVNFNFISFFDGQTNFSDNSSVGYTGPQISPDDSTMTLTNDLVGEYGSWFGHATHAITAFTASFDYQAAGQADGMAFILQNDPRGDAALGTDFAENGGTGLGYAGISPSAAVEFNFFGPTRRM